SRARRPTTMLIHGSPRTNISRSGGRKTAALRIRWRSTIEMGLPAEATGPARELEQRRVQCFRAEVRPQQGAEVELRVCALPDQVVGQALLAADSYHQVGIRQAGRVEHPRDGCLVDVVRVDSAGSQSSEGVHELRSPGVVEGDVELQAIAAGRRRECVLDRAARFGRQFGEAPQEPYLDSLRPEFGRLTPDRVFEKREESGTYVV